MKVRFSRLATRRLEEIASTIRRNNPSAAIEVERTIRRTCDLLAVYPLVGRAIKPHLRRLVVPRLPYLIYYQFDETTQTVAIVTIRHDAQRPLV